MKVTQVIVIEGRKIYITSVQGGDVKAWDAETGEDVDVEDIQVLMERGIICL